MNRWTLQAMASACLAIAGVACLAAASKPVQEREPANNASRRHPAGAGVRTERADLPAPRLPTKYREQRNDISFSVRMTSGPVVTVGGQVREPGPVKLGTAPDLWAAIQRAGGATEFGAMNRVRLTRGRFVKEYDMSNPEHRATFLSDRDTIEVPQKIFTAR